MSVPQSPVAEPPDAYAALTADDLDNVSLHSHHSNHDAADLPFIPPPKRSFMDRTFSTVQPGSVRGSIVSLAASAVGAGMLSLPSVLKNSGIVIGIAILLFGVFATVFTLHLLIKAGSFVQRTSDRTPKGSLAISINYPDLVRSTFGPRVAKMLEVTLFIYCFGTSVGFLTVIGKSVPDVLAAFSVHGVFLERWFVLLIAGALIFPLCLKVINRARCLFCALPSCDISRVVLVRMLRRRLLCGQLPLC